MGLPAKIDLTECDIVTIWESNIPDKQLARTFQVPETVVTLIKDGKLYSKITKDLVKSNPVNLPCFNHRRLTEEQAIYIIKSTETPKTLSAKLNISTNAIRDIRKGRTWKHLCWIPRAQVSKKLLKEENNGNAKLTKEKVLEIISLFPTHSNQTLGKMYGVYPSAISAIRKGQSWRSITGGVKQERSSILKGRKHPNAKVTEELVREIRNSTLSNGEWAKRTGLKRCSVWSIRHRLCWEHVE